MSADLYPTYAEAEHALREAEADVADDFGPEAVEAAWADIVRSVAASCPPGVAAELLRRQGL